jgi:hypothetical protein
MERVLLILYILGEYGPVERPILAKQFLLDLAYDDYLKIAFLLQQTTDDIVINFLRYHLIKYMEGVPQMGVTFDTLNVLTLEELKIFKRHLSSLPVTIGFDSISLYSEDGFPRMERRLVIRWHLPVVRDPGTMSGEIRIFSRKYDLSRTPDKLLRIINLDEVTPKLSFSQLESLFGLPTMIVIRNSLLDLQTKNRVIVDSHFDYWKKCDFPDEATMLSFFDQRWKQFIGRSYLFQARNISVSCVPITDRKSLQELMNTDGLLFSDLYYIPYPYACNLIKMVLTPDYVSEIVLGDTYSSPEYEDDQQLSLMIVHDVISRFHTQSIYREVSKDLNVNEVLLIVDGSNLAIIEVGDVERVTGTSSIAIEVESRPKRH